MSSNNGHSPGEIPPYPQQQNALFVRTRSTESAARQIRDNFTNVIREIEPLVEHARIAGIQNVTSFLNRSQSSDGGLYHHHHHHHHQHQRPLQNSMPDLESNNSFVINLEGVEAQPHPQPQQQQQQQQPVEEQPIDNSTNNNNQENVVDRAQIAEVQQFLKVALQYVPFFCILIAKGVFDYHENLFILTVLFIAFLHSNIVVKREATKRHRRNLGSLLIQLLYISVCFVFLTYYFSDELHGVSIVMNLVLIRTFTTPITTVGSLLYMITVTDYVLKLITVGIKVVLTMLPGRVVAFQKRGKMYLFLEAVSQTYRSIVTIQPWLNYLLESYEGPQKIVAVFLSAFYMIAKGTDLMSKFKLLKTTTLKVIQNVTVGSSPSKDEIQTAGEHCPICHDEYDVPVLLHCRHIFCEGCVTTWFDREQTCPLCRAKIVDDPAWRDGSTSHFVQLF